MLSSLQNHKTSIKVDSVLLQGILEGLIDGVLIVTSSGEWVYGNFQAYRICQRLHPTVPMRKSVPSSIWQVCQQLLNHQELPIDHPTIVESNIFSSKSETFRVRVRWLELSEVKCPYLLVTLEDCYQSTQSQAIAEIQQYDLTPRQADVWRLRRAGYSYREIANQLYVGVDTVKRHLKDIYAKQREYKLLQCITSHGLW
ncbi:helix-turn-helix transcriptional regulator [Pantanalinema sp. GBBB05]|uniref:helix-turn-helix transcriptional regulator n=1 Tax=Pantanalinema sp. GBBB05 TaxID=2604139 RepID=UPI001DFAACDA|nr:helix-turn-helix transcriptional regulator [Pantanalinema sp. GBBB05]